AREAGINAAAVGDFNGDGRADLVTVNYGSGDIQILLGRGDGTFQTGERRATGSDAVAVAVADFNGDGRLDLAVGNYSTRDVSILLGRGDGTFGDSVSFAVGTTPIALVA